MFSLRHRHTHSANSSSAHIQIAIKLVTTTKKKKKRENEIYPKYLNLIEQFSFHLWNIHYNYYVIYNYSQQNIGCLWWFNRQQMYIEVIKKLTAEMRMAPRYFLLLPLCLLTVSTLFHPSCSAAAFSPWNAWEIEYHHINHRIPITGRKSRKVNKIQHLKIIPPC